MWNSVLPPSGTGKRPRIVVPSPGDPEGALTSQLTWRVRPAKVASGPKMVMVTRRSPPCIPELGPPYGVKLWKPVTTQVPLAKTEPSGLKWVKEPPPLPVALETSNVPEPVRRRTAPASIGVPGMVLAARAWLGPIRLKAYVL